MKVFLLILKLIYFLLLVLGFIIVLYPGNQYWDSILSILLWVIGVGYLFRVLRNDIHAGQIMKEGLTLLLAGLIISLLGFFVAGETFLKLGFLIFLFGIAKAFLEYKKATNANK